MPATKKSVSRKLLKLIPDLLIWMVFQSVLPMMSFCLYGIPTLDMLKCQTLETPRNTFSPTAEGPAKQRRTKISGFAQLQAPGESAAES